MSERAPVARLPAGASLREIVGVERSEAGAIVAVFVDGPAARLTELHWSPGATLEARTVTLSAPVIDWPGGASLSGGHVLLSSLGGSVQLLDRRSGLVEQPGKVMSELAVLTRDGRHVVSATGHGLLRHSVGRIGEGAAHLHGTAPMHVMDLDSPHSMALVPGDTARAFSVVVGCYGTLAVIEVTDFVPQATAHKGRVVETSALPYDPVHVVRPVALHNGPGTRVFVTDEGRAGLLAVSLMPGLVDRCPLEDRDYGAVRHVVPRLDGRQCLVLTRGDLWVRWLPGASVVKPVTGLRGWPLLWDGDTLVSYDREAGEVREIRLD